MRSGSLVLDPDFTIGPVDRRLFGSFVEHMGRAVYTGVFEPGHPEADENGFRGDVLRLVRELGVSVVRYPGGNFVSGYRWEDGVGPVGERPNRLDLAWRQHETNRFGLDEFVCWTRSAGVEPMMAVNLGTRGVQEACDLLEYANHDSGTYWSDLRVKHGSPAPHDIRLWCLGNEPDGPWQLGAKTAYEYGRLANETAKAMRRVDPGIELVLCGSSNSSMPTFGTWEATALEQAYDTVDYISLHAYYEERDHDLASFLASAVDMDGFIDGVVATADHVRAKLRERKKMMLSFDEWNVWTQRRFTGRQRADWEHAPRLIEETYTAADAVVVGSYLITLLRHADRVRVACQAQLVNVIAPIRTEPSGPSWRQTTYHPFALTARWARGTVLRVESTSPQCVTSAFGAVPALDAVATHDEDTGDIALFCVNRSTTDALPVSGRLGTREPLALLDAVVVAAEVPHAVNDPRTPDRVVPKPLSNARVDANVVTALLPPASWSLIRLSPETNL
ncbi:alpha-N-arabinofuranosidase [Saccharothrix tamanrassetensis]|uniref:non-reducing end alpha-L-arabinofuranosidase n=1 Tax=Saccharothrix tamanrassetensis TaxID=1051531 RepID=A0A841CTW3_9PSEU|nr:alpha-N-arabinofuranosidase [Saccharothrix tamanrassetensis]MBB5959754.1 alpha-N-arabinofuranosidase [Saccharothrix tamanrassetensis]